MFKKKAQAPVRPPTSKVLVREYNAKLAKKGLATAAFAGYDDAAVTGITAYFEQEANRLAEWGYLPVAQAWAGGTTMMGGPSLTVTYVKSQP